MKSVLKESFKLENFSDNANQYLSITSTSITEAEAEVESPLKKMKMSIEAEEEVVEITDINLKHAHERDRRICRHPDESLHIYLLDGEPIKISGTGFKGKFFPPFDSDKILRGIFGRSKCYTERYKTKKGTSELEGMTKQEIAKMWNKSGENGTALHYCCEIDVQRFANIDPREILPSDRLSKFVTPSETNNDSYKSMYRYAECYFDIVNQYYDDGWRPYRTEWIIFDEAMDLAGCIDAVYYKVNTNTLKTEYMVVDWKTSKPGTLERVYDKVQVSYPIEGLPNCKKSQYLVQLNLYMHILRVHYNLNVIKGQIVVFYGEKSDRVKVDEIDITKLYEVYKNNMDFYESINNWENIGECIDGMFPKFISPIYIE